jgi:hypothetical protein
MLIVIFEDVIFKNDNLQYILGYTLKTQKIDDVILLCGSMMIDKYLILRNFLI